MDVQVQYFKLNIKNMKTNVYGEAKHGLIQVFKKVNLHCIVEHSAEQLDFSQTVTYSNNTIFKFLNSTLQQKNIVPQIGDIIMWNKQFWQITITTQQQLIGNIYLNKWSTRVQTTIITDSKVKQLLQYKD